MNTTEEAKEDLHAEAQSLLKQHVALMRKINTLTIERILIENRLADIDEALKGAQLGAPPISRLDSRGAAPE